MTDGYRDAKGGENVSLVGGRRDIDDGTLQWGRMGELVGDATKGLEQET